MKFRLTLGLALLLSACGQTGPLYLPDAEPPPVTDEQEDDEEQRQKAGADGG